LKNIFRNTVGCIITAALTVALLMYMGYRLDPPWSEDGLDAVKAFHSLPEDSLDVIVYGSSHAWKGCDTRVMYEKYGLEAYNYACNWQYMNTTLLFLQDSLRTQHPKVVCIDTYNCNELEIDTNMDGQIYYTRAIRSFDGKKEYLKQCFGNDLERYASYYFPIIMFHDNWSGITYENYLKRGPDRFVNTRGYVPNETVYPGAIPDYRTVGQAELSEEAVAVLDKIVSCCKEKDIQLIFYTCPYMWGFIYSDAMQKYCDDRGCTYLNLFQFCEEMDLSGETDFQDSAHLNSSGSAKVADFLGQYIIENVFSSTQ
jgi:hypothetical protein